MNRKITAGTLAITACLLLWIALRSVHGEPDIAASTPPMVGESAVSQQNENPEEKSADEGGGETAAQMLTFAVTDFTEFLAERPDDPAVANAVYDLTEDRSYLLECLRKWPTSPDLLSRAALGESDPEEKLRYAERLIQASPEHSPGYYQKSVALLKLGKADLAESALDHPLLLSPPVVDDQRAINLRRQALESAGRSGDEVRICSLFAGKSISCLDEDLRIFSYSIEGGSDAGTEVGPERAIAMAEHVIQVPTVVFSGAVIVGQVVAHCFCGVSREDESAGVQASFTASKT